MIRIEFIVCFFVQKRNNLWVSWCWQQYQLTLIFRPVYIIFNPFSDHIIYKLCSESVERFEIYPEKVKAVFANMLLLLLVSKRESIKLIVSIKFTRQKLSCGALPLNCVFPRIHFICDPARGDQDHQRFYNCPIGERGIKMCDEHEYIPEWE